MKTTLSNDQWVEVKESFTWGERRRLQESNPYVRAKDGEAVDPKVLNDWSADLVIKFIASWSFSEPITRDSLESLLTAQEGEDLLDAALQTIGFRSKDSDGPKGR